jgi:hypothetical protein
LRMAKRSEFRFEDMARVLLYIQISRIDFRIVG